MPSLIVIAEAGVNHNGELDRAREMVHAAGRAGADYVKFQGFRTEEIVTRSSPTTSYQQSNTGKVDQYELLADLEIGLDELAKLAKECRSAGIGFMCTPFDMAMVRPLLDMGMDQIKIPSGEITNDPLLELYGSLGVPIILSTGMSYMTEVREAIKTLKNAGCSDLTLLHCTSLYPAPPEKLNLRAMVMMHEETGLPVGYSDHSLGDHAAVAAVVLGAVMIEKHFTLDRSLPGPDHLASLEPGELAEMITRLRDLEAMLGDGEKRPAPGESETAALVRRSWHAARDIVAGTVLTEDDLNLKRPADGMPPAQRPHGMAVTRNLGADDPVRAEDVDEAGS